MTIIRIDTIQRKTETGNSDGATRSIFSKAPVGLVQHAFSCGSPQARLYGLPPLGWRSCPGARPRASSAARCAASRRSFAARIAARRSSRRRDSSADSSPPNDSPKRASSSASVSRALLDSASISSSKPRPDSGLRVAGCAGGEGKDETVHGELRGRRQAVEVHPYPTQRPEINWHAFSPLDAGDRRVLMLRRRDAPPPVD